MILEYDCEIKYSTSRKMCDVDFNKRFLKNRYIPMKQKIQEDK